MSIDLHSIMDSVEKRADLSTDWSRLSGGLRAAYDAAGGFVGGMRGTADKHREMAALQRLATNPSTPDNVRAAVTERIAGSPGASAPGGLFRRMAEELRGGVDAARSAWHGSSMHSDLDQLSKLNTPLTQQVLAGPNAQAAAAVGQRAHPPQWALDLAPKKAPGMLRRAAPYAIGLGALGLGGYAAWRGSQAGAEQDTRATDYINNARHDAATPLPDMTVQASYDDYEKSAAFGDKNSIGSVASKKVFEGIGGALATKFVSDPVDALHKQLKKTIVDQPKWDANFHAAVQGDPELRDAYEKDPEKLKLVFESVKRYGPSMAKDQLGTRSVLRHALVTDGHMDWNTMKAIAEIEKFHAEAKGRR